MVFDAHERAFAFFRGACTRGIYSSDVIINILARQRDPGPTSIILAPDGLALRHVPTADCARYDQLRSR